MKFEKLDNCRWVLPKSGDMRVPGLVYATEEMLSQLERDKVAAQVLNVACLPGITGYSFAMPDAHWGYGFPIGGVAAMREDDGVISPGGVGYDISCGVRLLISDIPAKDIRKKLPNLLDALFNAIPSGVGSEGDIRLDRRELTRVLTHGARWAVERGRGGEEDLLFCEENGCCLGADPDKASDRAFERGLSQLGTLGSGNHFIEVQAVDTIYDQNAARAFGLAEGLAAVLIHTGSRGFGYQVCEDYVRLMQQAVKKYGIVLQDRQLVCAPVKSPEGRDYFSAMTCAANYARANRQLIGDAAGQVFNKIFGRRLRLVYDLSHNIARLEQHKGARYCVHRKGATLSLPPDSPEVPLKYRPFGQPVLVPGSMGTHSYVLAGTKKAADETFSSVCHGAGRVMSRTQAQKTVAGRQLINDLAANGIAVRTDYLNSLAEEAPHAYKDVDCVVAVCENAGIARRVARLKPLGVIKG